MVLADCGQQPRSGLAYLVNLAWLDAHSRRFRQIVKGKGNLPFCALAMSGPGEKEKDKDKQQLVHPFAYCTFTGTVSRMFSHSSTRSAVSFPFLSKEIVNCSTGALVCDFFRSTRARSCFSSYSVPH